MYKITAPEKHYNGVTSGIVFANGIGIAELDAFSKDWFLSKGYTVEETTSTPVTGNTEAGTKGEDQPLSKAELTKIATDLGIEIKGKKTNAEIEKLIADKKAELSALENNEGELDTTPVTGNTEAGEQENGDPEKGE